MNIPVFVKLSLSDPYYSTGVINQFYGLKNAQEIYVVRWIHDTWEIEYVDNVGRVRRAKTAMFKGSEKNEKLR